MDPEHEREERELDRRNERRVAIIGGLAVVVAALLGGFFLFARSGSGTPSPPPIVVEDNDGHVCSGTDFECEQNFNEAPNANQRAWTSLAPFEVDLPEDWVEAYDWEAELDSFFGDESALVGQPDDFARTISYRRVDSSTLEEEATDWNTLTATPDFWPPYVEPVFYARAEVTLSAGSLGDSACGLVFNWNYSPDYTEVERGWFLAKASGTTAQVTQGTDPPPGDDVKHTQWAAYPEALAAHAPVLIEVYSDVNGWRVGIDGRQVLAVDTALDSAAAVAPVIQQETTRLSGRVVCHLADFRIWTPAGGTADWPDPSE